MLANLRALRTTRKYFAFRTVHKSKIDDDFSIAFIQNGLKERLQERQLEKSLPDNDDYGRTFPALDDYDIFDAETKQILQESMAISHKKN